jgi:hypothetical protein
MCEKFNVLLQASVHFSYQGKVSNFQPDVTRVPGGKASYPLGLDGPDEKYPHSQKKMNILVMIDLPYFLDMEKTGFKTEDGLTSGSQK